MLHIYYGETMYKVIKIIQKMNKKNNYVWKDKLYYYFKIMDK